MVLADASGGGLQGIDCASGVKRVGESADAKVRRMHIQRNRLQETITLQV